MAVTLTFETAADFFAAFPPTTSELYVAERHYDADGVERVTAVAFSANLPAERLTPDDVRLAGAPLLQSYGLL